MKTEKSLSKAKKRLFERQQKIVNAYLEAKKNKSNITEWKNNFSEELGISVHAVEYTIRPANLKRILDRSKQLAKR